MRDFILSTKNFNPAPQVVNIQEEKKIEQEALALVELHDFIKAHPDGQVKEIAKFMPPVDSRAVSKAIQMLAMRNENSPRKDSHVEADSEKALSSIDAPNIGKWGNK